MNNFSSTRNSKFATRNSQLAFTLVELLVVITIIGLLAALIVTGAGYAAVTMRKSRVQAERDALVTAIEEYKAHQGYYPPDNTNNAIPNNTAMVSLYYELTGATPTNGGNTFVGANHDVLTGGPTGQLNTLFNVGGILNASADPTQPAKNYFGAGKSIRSGTYTLSGATYTVFGVPVPPGSPASLGTFVSGVQVNPWHYVSTNPTNNQNEFDLWMDVEWRGKTNRISNWTKDPVPLN